MAQKRKMEGWSNEELIVAYAENFYNGTKKAAKFEKDILEELIVRNVIDRDKMNELYKRKSLGNVI